jgi:glyoxylase-like metal-dependent hydrolase (beta-lactamase superfamily II)/rhodanese-related sulfurtransferase
MAFDRYEIEVDTLRAWLEAGRKVEVIDVRPRADYEAWHIPGSRNVDAYQSLQTNDPGSLADYKAREDTPVVAVCFVGQTSQIAAYFLRTRGIPALSLAGGMQAWGLAWNTAEVPLKRSKARVIQVRRTGKGCLSYLVGSTGEAIAIDASVDPQVYLDLAARQGWRLTGVLDSHIHADHLSRSRELAKAADGEYFLPRQERVAFAHRGLDAGEVIRIGEAQLEAIHTPGHTYESMSFLLDDEALFTGDTLFLDSVGRPDLKADQNGTERRARALFKTLQQLLALDPGTLILPGHTGRPAPFDRIPLAAPLNTVIENVPALGASEEAFIDWILGRIPPTPSNYETIVRLNEAGILPGRDSARLEAGANRCAI